MSKIQYIYTTDLGNTVALDSLVSSRNYVVCRKQRKNKIVVELETDSIEYARAYCEQKGNYSCYISYMNQALQAETFGRKLAGDREYKTFYNGLHPAGVSKTVKLEGDYIFIFQDTDSSKLNTVKLI